MPCFDVLSNSGYFLVAIGSRPVEALRQATWKVDFDLIDPQVDAQLAHLLGKEKQPTPIFHVRVWDGFACGI